MYRPHKRDLLRSVAAAALAGPARALAQRPPAPPRGRGERMNLLFITVDDMDASLPGFMGNRAGLTPNLDALARRSHRFVNNRTVAPICMPSREAFMTGLLPHRSGGTGFVPVREGTPSLTSILRGEGYFTAAVHKIDHMLPQSSFPWDYAQQGTTRHRLVQAAGARVAMMEAAAQDKPFFLQCNINDPHRPFYGSEDAARKDHGQQGPYRIERTVQPEDVVVPPMLDDLPPVRREIAQYWNSARRMDAALGLVLDALAESGAAGRTAIVFCADHGMPFPFAKATCYDHGTRVPTLVCWPGMTPPRTFADLVTNVDIMPTALDLLGVAIPAGIDGRSWLGRMRGGADAGARYQITQVNQVSSGMAYPARAIQDARHSLVVQPWADGKLEMRLESMMGLTWPAMLEAARSDQAIAARVRQYRSGVPLALYDLAEDPGQRRNLVRDPRHAARVATMTAALLAGMERTGDPELDNVRAVCAGRAVSVPQDPERYRLRTGGEG